MAGVQQKCCVFIDNSNLFIEGQRFSARRKNFRGSDPKDIRFRIEMGHMFNALLQKREYLFAKLYGSKPPANDSLWEMIRSMGLEVKTFDRNAKNREKQVDTALTADVTEQACVLREPAGSVTFIIIGGDCDFLPGYEMVLKYNYKLEIAAWTHSLAQKVRDFAMDNQTKGVSLIMLEELAASNPGIYFFEERWKNDKHFDLYIDRTIVFQYGKPLEDREAKQLNSEVTDLIRFPCWYRHRPETDAKTVMIIIITDQQEGEYKMDDLCQRIIAKFAARCEKIVDCVSFQQEQNPAWQNDPLFMYKKFETEAKELKRQTSQDAAVGGEESDKDGFVEVKRKKKEVKQKSSNLCPYRFACKFGEDCPYAHSKDEKEHFKKNPDKLGKLYKAKFCVKCQYQRNPKQCCYAHDASEARCYRCDPGGLEGKHWMDKCPKLKSTSR